MLDTKNGTTLLVAMRIHAAALTCPEMIIEPWFTPDSIVPTTADPAAAVRKV